MSVLVVAEHDNKNLKSSTLNTISAAEKLSEDIHLLILGNKIEDLAKSSKSIQLVKKVIIPNLETGKVVITDRFSDSSIAYQGYGGGLDIKLIETLNNISTSNLKPDLTFLLDLNSNI